MPLRIIFLLAMLLLSCQSWGSSEISQKILEYFNTNCNEADECKVELAQLTPFEWDTLYVFNGYYSADDINEAVGFYATGRYLNDDWQQLMFVKDQQLVYHEEYPWNKLNIQFKSIDYKKWNRDGYDYYSKQRAVFLVSETKRNDGSYVYNLTPLHSSTTE